MNTHKRNAGRALCASMILLGSTAITSLAQPNSPVGTWDCVLSGHRQGTAYLTFNPDGTFSGYEVMVPNKSKSSPVRGGGESRNGDTQTTSDNSTPQQIFGFETPNGTWNFDIKGRTIGYFIEVSALQNCTTNAFPFSTNNIGSSADPTSITNDFGATFCVDAPYQTNVVGGVTNYLMRETCYTNISVCEAITNAISFTGKVTPGKRLNLVCATPFGKTQYRGVPLSLSLTNLSGEWYGMKRQNKIDYLEYCTLSPTTADNVYSVSGTGPGYAYDGVAILSSQKKISYAVAILPPLPTDPIEIVRAVTGSFNPKKSTVNTKGWEQPSGSFTNQMTFQSSRVIAPF